jgi:two-component system cell cycle sensor histidine kinase/response regulator CckA
VPAGSNFPPSAPPIKQTSTDWLVGVGETGELIRSADWSATPLGPRDTWPQSLRTAVNMVLASNFPMAVLWGSELIAIYNEAYKLVIAAKHPKAMGSPSHETWPEAWEINEPIFQRVMTGGETVYLEDVPFLIARNDYMENAYFTIAYSPIRIEDHQIGGALGVLLDTTKRVLSEQQLKLAKETLEVQLEAQQRTEAALRDSEEQYRTLFDNAGDAIFIHDMQGCIQAANFLACERHGYTRQELMSLKIRQLNAPETLRQMPVRFSQFKESGQLSFETVHLHKDGSHIPMEVNARQILWRGQPAIMTICRDITERKRAENAVRESEERFRLIADSIDEVFWMADVVEARILYISPAYERIWGQSRQELYENRKAFRKTIHPEDFDRTIETLKIQKTGQAYDHEYRIIRPDGSVRQIWDRGFPVEDGSGCVRLYVGVAQDVTNWRNAEKKHKEAEDYLHKIINCIADPIFVKDRQHRFLLINDAVCTTMGKPAEEIISSISTENLPMEVVRELFEQEDRVFETGNPGVSVNEVIGKDGHLYTFMSNKTLLTDADGNKQLVAVLRDITDIKKAEKERSEIELQLRQMQKLEAVGRLAGGVAHDLNNMLGVIIGNAEMALSETHPAEPVYEELTEIHKAAERSANLTRQLLAFARRQTAAPKVLDLNKIISGMANMLKSLIGENISFNWRPAENLWQVKMDPSQMDQILTNVCTNARDAISNTGKITIETGNCIPNEDFCAAHPWFVPGEYVQLAVSDDGCGMDKDTLAQIFEPFFTTKGIGKGTGLGLSTVYGIVKQNNCFINVNSNTGKGTACVIYLPRYAGEAEQTREEGATSAAQGGHEIILLVEDEPAMLQMATRMLETNGYKVLAASTPRAAVRLAKEHSGEISLLLTDVVMPEMSGQELAKYLLSLYPQLKRLFMSGYTADVISGQGVLDEGVHFIQKPFSMQDLAVKVREVLEAV